MCKQFQLCYWITYGTVLSNSRWILLVWFGASETKEKKTIYLVCVLKYFCFPTQSFIHERYTRIGRRKIDPMIVAFYRNQIFPPFSTYQTKTWNRAWETFRWILDFKKVTRTKVTQKLRKVYAECSVKAILLHPLCKK